MWLRKRKYCSDLSRWRITVCSTLVNNPSGKTVLWQLDRPVPQPYCLTPLLYNDMTPSHISFDSPHCSVFVHPKKARHDLTLDSIAVRDILKTSHSCTVKQNWACQWVVTFWSGWKNRTAASLCLTLDGVIPFWNRFTWNNKKYPTF